MDLHIAPSPGLRGTVAVPPNKSHSFRALVAAGLADGVSTIRNPALSGDWRLGVKALQMLGAHVEQSAPDAWQIRGVAGRPVTPPDVIDCGNSGLVFRLFTAVAAIGYGCTVLTGDESIRTIRPIGPLVDALLQLGAFAVSTKGDGHAPVVVGGPLHGGVAEFEGADSQYISALLFAVAAAGVKADIRVTNAGEKPWVALTLNWLDRLGVHVQHENFEHYLLAARTSLVTPAAATGPTPWAGFDFTVPADWSAALYPLIAALISPGSEVAVTGIDSNDPQPDRMVVDVLKRMGGDINQQGDRVTARSSQLRGLRIDCNDFIDQFPLLAVVGCFAEGETKLVNAAIARHKECDRISQTARSLRAMGADLDERPDGLTIRRSPLAGCELDSQADHRMVMTLAVAAVAASSPSTIRRAECVSKTFAEFPEAMARLGAKVSAFTE
jgi:3-phosphoshikimate 1-carboxyvinyltransferase